MKEKLINGFAWLQTKHFCLREAAKRKDGQAVLEYAIIFFVAGLGTAIVLSKFQTNAEISLNRQAQQLTLAGKSLF